MGLDRAGTAERGRGFLAVSATNPSDHT